MQMLHIGVSVLLRMLSVIDSSHISSNSSSNSSSSDGSEQQHLQQQLQQLRCEVTHLSCDPVTLGVVLGLVGGRTVSMWDIL
jgi:hypothetical protein